jgi:hypothetical protein
LYEAIPLSFFGCRPDAFICLSSVGIAMNRFWRGFARLLAVLCAIVFVLTAVAALLLAVFDQELLVSSTYKDALAGQQAYTRLPIVLAGQLVYSLNYNPCVDDALRCENIIADVKDCARTALGDQRYEALASGDGRPTDAERVQLHACVVKYQPDLQASAGSSGGIPAFIRSIGAPRLENVIAGLLPSAQTKPLADDFIDQLFSYLNGRQDSVTLHLVGLKASLTGPAGLKALLDILRAQPNCTLDQLARMTASALSGKGELLMCRPPDQLIEMVTPLLQSVLDASVSLIPDNKVISIPAAGSSANFGPFGKGPVGGIRLALTLLRLGPDVPLFFLLLVSLLVIRSPRELLRWWGIPLFFAGLLAVILALIAPSFFERSWLVLLLPRFPPALSLGLVALIHDLVRAVLQTYLRIVIYAGGAMAFLGLLLWIASAFLKSGLAKTQPSHVTSSG